MRTQKLVYLTAATIAAVFTGSKAQAAFDSYAVDVGPTHTLSLTIDSVTHSGMVGQITVKKGADPTILTVCTDISGTLFVPGTYSFEKRDFASSGDGLNPDWGSPSGLPAAAQAIQNAADIFFNNVGAVTAAGDADHWAALQLAVWEALYDSGTGSSTFDLSSGRFSTTAGGTTLSLAKTYLELPGAYTRSQDYTGYVLFPQDATAQELFVGVTPVPEANTVIASAGSAGIMSIFGLLAYVQGRGRKKETLSI